MCLVYFLPGQGSFSLQPQLHPDQFEDSPTKPSNEITNSLPHSPLSGGKVARLEAGHLPPSAAKVR